MCSVSTRAYDLERAANPTSFSRYSGMAEDKEREFDSKMAPMGRNVGCKRYQLPSVVEGNECWMWCGDECIITVDFVPLPSLCQFYFPSL